LRLIELVSMDRPLSSSKINLDLSIFNLSSSICPCSSVHTHPCTMTSHVQFGLIYAQWAHTQWAHMLNLGSSIYSPIHPCSSMLNSLIAQWLTYSISHVCNLSSYMLN